MVLVKAKNEEIENFLKIKYSKESYIDFINSDEWKEKRSLIIQDRGQICERCGEIIENKNKLHLHHRDYDKEFGTEADEDLMILCEDCHHNLHRDDF